LYIFQSVILTFLILAYIGCGSDDVIDNPPIEMVDVPELSDSSEVVEELDTITPIPINDHFNVGTVFTYVLFYLDDYRSEGGSPFFYTRDTLHLEVVGIEQGKYLVSEKVKRNTDLPDRDDYYWASKDSVFLNYWFVKADTLFIEFPREKYPPHSLTMHSHLFDYGGAQLPLGIFTETEVSLDGWKPAWPYTERTFELFINNVIIGGIVYPRLNVLLDDKAMSHDGNGHTYFYSQADGVIRTSHYRFWSSNGWGWDLIEVQ